ncbi:MAG: hypothetical protein Q8O89_06170 [Nanoarchaeota archaeon]|nr:hypothetical protein [Nanoarchaeota archaeon]
MIYMCLDMGFKFKHTIVWDKGVFLNDWNIHQCRMRENHEFVWVFEK